MSLSRREFLGHSALALSSLALAPEAFARKHASFEKLMEFKPYGNLTLVFISDFHGHLKPMYFAEPMNLLAPEPLKGTPGYLAGMDFLKFYNIKPGSVEAYMGSCVSFIKLARMYGMTGGGPQVATVIKAIVNERGRDKCLVLDGGDTWATSGIAVKTDGMAVVDWLNYVGFDYMVAHWDVTVGKEKFLDIVKNKLKAKFISYNITEEPFGDLVFPPYDVVERGGVKIGIIGSSFPFTPLANPRVYTEGWSFGVRPDELQKYVNELREKHKVDLVLLLSHDGLPLDIALMKIVKGIDIVISGHTHDITPTPVKVGNTLIVSPGSHGKFVGRMDLDVRNGKLHGYRLKLIPVLSDVVPEDKGARELVKKWYAPYEKEFNTVIGTAQTMLYKRDTVFSTWDRLIGEALADYYHGVDAVMSLDVGTSPGFRWGTTVLPGQRITVEHVYDVLGMTYPEVFIMKRKGRDLLALWEDVADNVFNPNPLYQQGGDMSRIYGVEYELKINTKQGDRIRNVRIKGKPIELDKEYLVAVYGGPPPMGVQPEKKNIREIVIDYIRKKKDVHVDRKPNVKVLDHPYNTDCYWR
ncbi:MAG: thiosulfohydrolase SoxB [Aquificaceae bacterium]|nr:thiosulfohydrolase SoxB [Aquificaceae bacterium]MDW8423346.1 thiosulfohydrolase SoxB [Aquificaceae bacterium]